MTNMYKDRNLWRDNQFVHKVDHVRLGNDWRSKMEQIISVWSIPTFVDFIEDGYTTRYIDGTDLHGNEPFSDKIDNQCILSDVGKLKVIDIFADAMRVGEKLGFTLGDITCGNIMVKDGFLYLIDFEVIIPYPLPVDNLKVWMNTLDIVFLERNISGR